MADKPAKGQVQQAPQPWGLLTNGHYLQEGGLPLVRNKVAIIGFAPSSMGDARAYFTDPDTEFWGLNQLYLQFPLLVQYATRWFQIHPRREYDMAVRDHAHHDWLAQQTTFPIYMQRKEPDVPLSIPYPKDEIIDYFGRYFTNSISWEIALAIYETVKAREATGDPTAGFKHVYIFGVDMATDSEYCNSPYTKVLNANLEWVDIGAVKVGDKLIAFDEHPGTLMPTYGNKRQWRCTTVEKTIELKQPCCEICLEDGTELISSKLHRWLTYPENEYKWRKTEQLVTPHHRPDRPSKIAKLLDVWKEDNSWDAGYLAAAFDGEGCCPQNYRPNTHNKSIRLQFTQKDNGMLGQVDESLRRLGFDFIVSKNKNIITYNIKGGRPEILRFLGQIRPRRLMENFKPDMLGVMYRKDAVGVKSIKDIGEQTVIGLKTSDGTYVAEGFASHNSEQRPSCEFFIGWARGLGINVYIPPQSDMLKTTWLYPFEDDSLMRQKIDGRRRELRQRVEQLAQQEQAGHDGRLSILGALENMNYINQTWLHNRKLLTFTEGPGYDQDIEPPDMQLGFPPTGNESPKEPVMELYPAIEKQDDDKKE